MVPESELTSNAQESEPKIAPRILLFYDYACPFCYVDQFRFDRLVSERDVDIVLVPFELRPDMPDEGHNVSELEAAGMDHGHIEEHLRDLSLREGFPLTIPPFLPKTHLALVWGEMARDRGIAEHMAIHHVIFGAYFGDGVDIGSREVLLGLASAYGYDPDELALAWDDGTYDERLHQFRHVAMQLGIESTPAALVCNELLIGSRPYRNIQDALDRCIVTPENIKSLAAEA